MGFRIDVMKIGDPPNRRYVIYRADETYWTGLTFDPNLENALFFDEEREACRENCNSPWGIEPPSDGVDFRSLD